MNITELKTTIKDVTVYVDRARITRGGKLSFEPGAHRVEIKDLPTAIEPESVRVRARGTARAIIRGVDVRKSFYKDVPPGKIRDLTDKIQELEDKDLSLSDTAESITGEIKHLDGLSEATRTYAVSLAKGNTTIESHAALIDFITRKRTEAQARLRKNMIERRNISDEITKLKNELKQIQHIRPRERYTAEVELEVTQGGDLEMALSYIFLQAWWTPLYDIRLLDSQLEISYLGQVSQSSGEDWNNISLTLSTARPSASSTVPEPDPWFISVRVPLPPMPPMDAAPPPGMRRKRGPQPSASPKTYSAEAEPDMLMALQEDIVQDAETAFAGVEQYGAFVTYTVGDGIDIPGNGSPHKSTIALFKLSPELDYVVAPKLEELAYRRVFAVNQSPYVLLPGTAQLFEGEDYVGSVDLKLIATGEKLKLYFGTDDRIRVKRELVNRETEKKFMADKRRIRFAYEIKLENLTGETQTVIVTDQIPVSKHEDIKIKLEDTVPEPSNEDELGRLKWKLPLPAGKKEQIRFDFYVEYPRDANIVGLP